MAKLNEKFVKFAEQQNLDVDLFKQTADYFCHYMSEVQHKNLGAYDKEASLAKKEEQLLEAFNKEVARLSQTNIDNIKESPALMQNPMVQWASMSIMTEMIDAVLPLTIVDSIGLYTDIKTVNFNESAQFDIAPNSLYTVSRSANGQRDSFVQKDFKSTRTLNPISHDITVQTTMYRVMCGYESIGEFLMKAVLSMETAMSLDAYKAFASTFEKITFPKELSVTGYTAKGLLGLCQKVQAYNGGERPVIVGTAIAISNIVPPENYHINTDANAQTIQLIRNFYDYDILVLPQIATGKSDYSLALADNRAYIMSTGADKLVKGVIEGVTQTNTNDFYDKANLTSNTTLRKRWIFEVITNAVAGVLKFE